MPGVVKPPAAALKKTTAAATPVESSRPDEQTPTANAYSSAAWWSWIEQGLRPWLNALVIAWCVGVILFLMTLGMFFTGQILRWDPDAYWGLAVAGSMAGRVPVIGPWVVELVKPVFSVSSIATPEMPDIVNESE